MTSYWYSTNGLIQQRLPNRHLSVLDEAFEQHVRIQIVDEELFGGVPAIANPYQGTMTAGDLHYGLYRQPPMWRMSNTSLDTLILIDTDNVEDSTNNKETKYNKFIQKRRMQTNLLLEENCVCCRIS